MEFLIEYDVLLSYPSADREVGEELAERLRGDRLRVFCDRWPQKRVDDINQKARGGWLESQVILVFVSKEARLVKWGGWTRHYYIEKFLKEGKQTLCRLQLDSAEGEKAVRDLQALSWREQNDREYGELMQLLQVDEWKRFDGQATLSSTEALLKESTDNGISSRIFPLDSVGTICSIACTHNGRYVLLGSADGSLHLWDLNRGKNIRTLKGHAAAITSVALSSDGSRAISVSIDGTLRRWDLSERL